MPPHQLHRIMLCQEVKTHLLFCFIPGLGWLTEPLKNKKEHSFISIGLSL